MRDKFIAFAIAGSALMFLANSASAQTIGTGPANGGSIGVIGNQFSLDALGQNFISPGGVLNDFTFYNVFGTGNVQFVVTSFDGVNAGSMPLYSSGAIALTSKSATLDFSGLAIATLPGDSYIAYLTSNGVTNATMSGNLGVARDGLPYTDGNLFGRVYGDTQFYDANLDAAFNATFLPDVIAVPEPATWAMMLPGLGAVGFAMRRRQKVTTLVASSV